MDVIDGGRLDDWSESTPMPERVGQSLRSRGRPSLLDDTLRDKLVLAILAGNSRGDAAEYAGVSRATLYRWLGDGKHADLVKQIDEAEATARVVVVSNLVALTRTSSRAAIAWLKAHGDVEWKASPPIQCPNCGHTVKSEPKMPLTAVVAVPPKLARELQRAVAERAEATKSDRALRPGSLPRTDRAEGRHVGNPRSQSVAAGLGRRAARAARPHVS